jgi:hypothetical protein
MQHTTYKPVLIAALLKLYLHSQALCPGAAFRCLLTHRRSSGTVLASRHTAPATTGLATLVPLRLRQPAVILLPVTSLAYAITSGLMRPA